MPGWTTPRTWVAGEKPPAATMNAHIRDNLVALNGFVRKTSDEAVTSSAVLQNDDHLFYSIPATGTYVFDLFLVAQSAANAAGDLQVGFTFPTGTLTVGAHGADANLASGTTVTTMAVMANPSVASGAVFATFGVSTLPTFSWIHGMFIATATGTLQTQWSQAVSNANSTTVRTGSHLTVRQVA